MSWLRLLAMELDCIGNIVEPDREVDGNDSVVGEMSEHVRKLYTLGKGLTQEAAQNALDCHFCTDKVRKLELEVKAAEYLAKAETLREIMWIELFEEFGLWGKDIGVRTGFKVVLIKR